MSVLTRIRVLAIHLTLAGTLVILGKTLLSPSPIEPTPVPVVFPTESLPAGWEMLVSEPDPTLPDTIRYRQPRPEGPLELELQFIADLPTHYIRNSLLEMRFLPRGHLPLDAARRFYVNSRGQVVPNLQGDAPSDAIVEARKTSPTSGYGFWVANERLHLSTIVTPAGDTSMETRRAFRSLYVDPVDLDRIGKWLLGRTRLPDRRCVLVHFSIPAPAPAAQEEGRRVLETAWAEWQRAFQPVFPE